VPISNPVNTQAVVNVEKVVLVDALSTGQETGFGDGLGLGLAGGRDKGIGMLLGELIRLITAQIDEKQLVNADARHAAKLDPVSIDLVKSDIGIDVQALWLAKPLIEQLLMQILEAAANSEGDIVQLDIAAIGATAQEYPVKAARLRNWMAFVHRVWFAHRLMLLEAITEDKIRIDDQPVWISSIEFQQVRLQSHQIAGIQAGGHTVRLGQRQVVGG